ncbi:MAG TPA: tetratricopeptide repeat protein, partial [Chitinophagales bacterium]|nr:tetratricopeptide repeat protein [Chitinophagales bacterium]
MKKICFLVFLFTSLATYAQTGDYDAFLARQFVQNGEYAKAAEYYESLFVHNPEEYYTEYINVLIQLKDFAKAEKTIKTIYKQSDNNSLYLIDLGDLFLKQNKEEEASKQFNKTIKELKSNQYEIQQIANKFILLQQLEYAQKTYERGREILKNKNAFNLELAHLLYLKKDIEGMITAYLNEAPQQSNNLTLIENGLQSVLTEEKTKDALEKELLKRVQANKRAYAYQDLLIWLYMQRNAFEDAILQAKSLDLLRGEDGENVLRIARTALAQKDFDAAQKGFQYVVDKGASFPWYVTANLELINVKRDKIVNSPNYTSAELLSLKKTYQDFISTFKNEYTATTATLELAQLEALYIHDVDNA